MVMKNVLLVGAGGFAGSVARYLVALAVPFSGTGFPFATFAVNLLGSFLIGFISELALSTTLLSPEARLLLTTGFCGGFTTFSTAMYETGGLMRDGEALYASLYVAGSLAGGLACLFSGTLLAKLWQ
ncbi:MAG TPA: fluoride efflux transporter CrcB [Chlorobaculum sp.]|uniref:Fluoride-specific ion channel FluC n=2 Tax=Chlorobaculum tepidum TaxID=1097 RepID=FLUC_CHLTE|nr:RecName: Full=Fluoride-specific ion channel FluC [Chlorobaculum tepidum TLS]AAM73318.1 crcB protein [Chlorobaculum tepidum TLS]HBU23433.1 fluoride efflux transporter CrcB [Chlorobaculum sp.]